MKRIGVFDCQPKSMPRIDRCVKIALDALFPMRCMVCNRLDDNGLCPHCSANVPRVNNPCRQCGSPLAVDPGGAPCGRCQSRPPAYDATIAPFTYAPPLSGIVHQFKYRRRIALARPLAKFLAAEVRSRRAEMPELLIPVPLHWRRLMQRGFNQSLELCRHLSAEIGVPCSRRRVVRSRNTESQAGLSLRRRRRNIRGAFEVLSPLSGLSIAIVDDVITSGNTMREIAQAARKSGASDICCWSLLHTLVAGRTIEQAEERTSVR